MSILLLLVGGVAVLIFLIVRIARRGRKPKAFKLAEVGTIIDRSLRAYRQHLLPLLALAALLTPLGFSAGSSTFISLPLLLLGGGDAAVSLQGWAWLMLLGQLAIGKTLVACGAARAAQLHALGERVELRKLLLHPRWGAALGLAALLAVPAFISSFLGVIGLGLSLLWALAPAALIDESLGPLAALRRSAGMSWGKFSPLLNTLVPLWLIGWLIVGTPLFGSLLLEQARLGLPENMSTALILLTGLIGNIFVGPLMGMGTYQFFVYARERDAQQASLASLEALIATAPGGGARP